MIEVLAQYAIPAVEGLHDLGGLGVPLFGVAFIIATLACFPASALTAVAGFLYGPVWGMVLISPLGVLSAGMAFGLTRHIGRPWVHQRVAKRPMLNAIDNAVAVQGFRLVFLLRLSSIVPFAPLSYSLGASQINARVFLFASWLGLMPGTFLYVYLGSLVADLTQLMTGQSSLDLSSYWLSGLGLSAVMIALCAVARYTRQMIHESSDKEVSCEQAL